ncbi:uncharacterized protein LOC114481200 isoform X2 [Gouania willdenowi]|uniref:uncharacterized protein LOC114481200 isoform X2 n=1 Tax=Gouania willdenowi TaxID=441366 RepID=UPI0010560C44|nr:breast cancer type 1 susceptibility protein isoform X2 [Gouania willdenowi]
MATPKSSDVKKGISSLWDTLQCPICLDLVAAPVSTKCNHQFCKFCIFKLLDSSKQNKSDCPVCKAKITKRSLQESPGFQKLVAGLQDMIQSYQHDTGTNFFTGSSQQKRHFNPEAEATKEFHNLSPANKRGRDLQIVDDPADGNPPESHSSTIAARDGYAQLIGFEDVHFVTANEGLDSGLGDGPPASDCKLDNSAQSAETMQMELSDIRKEAISTLHNKGKRTFDESHCLLPNSEETEPHLLGKSLRRKKKKKPEEILEHRKKKSLEKVTEWLLKVPTQGSPELEDMENDAEDSDCGSCTSTIDIHKHNIDFNPRKEDKTKALEEQVFGAVYKRERRSNRVSSPPFNGFSKPSSNTKEKTCVSKSYVENDLTVDDFEQRSQENMETENGMEDLENTSSDFLPIAEQKVVREENSSNACMEEFKNLFKSDKNECLSMVSCPPSDIESQQQAEVPRRKTRHSLHQVDDDLKEKANEIFEGTEQKEKRKSNTRKSERNKPVRVAKPLVLVGVENGGGSPKKRGRSAEIQVQIESYPSSEDQEAPRRSTRKIKRLQDFQVVHKTKNSTLPGKARNVGKISNNSKCVTVESTTLLENGSKMKVTAINGCVYDQDLEEIENTGTNERLPYVRAAEDVAEPLPVETVKLPCASDVSVVPNSISPTQKDVLEPAQENKKPPDCFLNNTQSEASVCEAECAEMDNDENESDTEQLLKSFKATKRKSFNLHGPAITNTWISSSDKVNMLGGHIERQHQDVLDVGSLKPDQTHQKASSDSGKSQQSDLIPPSVSPALGIKKNCQSPDQVVVVSTHLDRSYLGKSRTTGHGNPRSSPSSSLTPNQVSKLEVESLQLSVVPQVVDAGLHFTTVGPEDDHKSFAYSEIQESELDCFAEDAAQVKEGGYMSMGHLDGDRCSGNRTEDGLIAESSLTPDGLTSPAVQKEPNRNSSGEISIHSSLKSNPRRKRRAQRLESSSGSDSSGSKEDFPSLAQIFRTTAAAAPAVHQDQEVPSEAERCEDVGAEAEGPSSPDCVGPSQASVDLFGTPEEAGDVPVINTEVSMESSQFSSEVLVTQQKMEMQKELVRLEKLMALVSEVLQEKEGSPSKDIPSGGKATGNGFQRADFRDQDTAQDSSWKDGAGAERDTNANTSERKGLTEACGTKLGSSKDIAAQPSSQSGPTFKAPAHSKAHSSTAAVQTVNECSSPSDGQEDKENDSPPKDKCKAKLLLVSSGLGPGEQIMVKKFAKRVGARVISQVTPEVTHVVMRTNEQLVCERTLKYFLGIAGRKWVVSFQWISECFKQKKLLDESPFEVRGDVVNGPNHQGPFRARTTDDRNLLMKGYKICFQGSFTDMSTVEMEWMVELCGAAVVKNPLRFDGKQKSNQLVIVQPRSDFSSSTSSNLSKHATVLTRGWLLDTVATYTLQNYDVYKT